MTYPELMRKIAVQWSELDEEKQEYWKKLAKDDHKRYAREMEVYENEQEELRLAEEKCGMKRPSGLNLGEGFMAEKRSKNNDIMGSDGEAETRAGTAKDTGGEDNKADAEGEESEEAALIGDGDDEDD